MLGIQMLLLGSDGLAAAKDLQISTFSPRRLWKATEWLRFLRGSWTNRVPAAAICATAGVLALVATACGGPLNDTGDIVGRYCNWGAVSRAQYEGCVEHVTQDEVSRRYERHPSPRSPAAVYAIECDLTSGAYTHRRRPACGWEY